MELSRQRLRPALTESAYIPCPRCHGIGHIRGTESTALHILRIIQEEAMKDNSAQVVAQVPVDVATFLLNEKRTEVLAIETRFKVNVLLVPNRHLETPNYSVERSRHDDLNQGEPLPPSFQMVQEPAKDDALVTRKEEAREPRPEPVVKGITPAQPAPMPPAQREGAAAAEIARAAGATVAASWLGRMLHWFRTPPALPRQIPAPAPAADAGVAPQRSREPRPARERGDARDGHPRGDGRRDGRTPRRDDGQPRRDGRRPDHERRDERRPATRGTPQGAIESAPADAAADRRSGRNGERRDARKPKRDTKPQTSPQPYDASIAGSADAAVSPPGSGETPAARTAPATGADEHREGGRRRRGRRGRGGEHGARPVDHATHAADGVIGDAGAVAASAPVSSQRFDDAVPASARPASAPDQAAGVPAQAMASPAQSPVAPAPTREPMSTPEALGARAPVISLALPPDSELVLVETRHAAPSVQNDEAPAPRPRRARAPRISVPDEPLQMVETRKE